MADTSMLMPPEMASQSSNALEFVLAAWLATIGDASVLTRRDYEAIFRRFQSMLDQAGLALNSPHGILKIAAERFAALGEVKATTRNKRLSVLRSFYHYAIMSDCFPSPNPIDRVQRSRSRTYAQARALDVQTVRTQLASIDRSTVAGLRDYALLSIALTTGRRVRELANLRWGHIHWTSTGCLQMTWAQTKGRDSLYDTLSPAIGQVLLEYVQRLYGTDLDQLAPQTPIWVSLSHNRRGAALTVQAIGDICEKHLGTGKVHQLRHTFAQLMEQKGATVSEIQRRLGHASVATTSIYLQAMRSDENQFSDELAIEFGLG